MVQFHPQEEMLLSPKKVKFIKQHSRKDDTKTLQKLGNFNYGYFAMYAEESGKICAKQIEAIRLVLRRSLKRQAKIWIKLYVHSSFTKKPNETRLGKGKGNVKYWNSIIQPGKLLIEIKGCNPDIAMQTLDKVKHKLSIKAMVRSKYSRWIL